ncbi:cdc12 like protein, partial [Aureobasidium melanogenum]
LQRYDKAMRCDASQINREPSDYAEPAELRISLDLERNNVLASNTALHALNLSLQLLDERVTGLEVLVEAITLGDELLFPATEALLLNLDLLCETFAQSLFLLLKLGVIKLAWPGFAELASLHLLCTVGLVVVLLCGVDQVEHVCADQHSAKLLEVAMFLVLDFSDTPSVLSALDAAAIGSGDILLGTNDGERHGSDKGLGVSKGGFIILLERGRIVGAEGICFCDDGNQVDTARKALHDFDVEGLQAVTSGTDEVQTGVDAQVDALTTTGLLLLEHVGLVLVVEELDDGSVDNGEANWRACQNVIDAESCQFASGDGGGGGLAETGLASNLGVCEYFRNAAPRLATILWLEKALVDGCPSIGGKCRITYVGNANGRSRVGHGGAIAGITQARARGLVCIAWRQVPWSPFLC